MSWEVNKVSSWDEIGRGSEKQKLTKREYNAKIKYDEIVMSRANDLGVVIDDDLSEGIQYRIVTSKSFNAISVIEYLMQKYELTEVYVAVYRMNLQSVRRIEEIVNKNIPCKVLLSSFFRENKKYEKWTKRIEEFGRSNPMACISFAWSHAKVFLAKTKCGKSIVFEGSGNLSDNARIEQYLIENNRSAYDFHSQWIDEIISEEHGA